MLKIGLLLATLGAVVWLGCSDGPAGPAPVPGLHITSGGDQKDTIWAELGSIVVSYRDSQGEPKANARLVLTDGSLANYFAQRTDANGVAEFHVTPTCRAGEHFLVVVDVEDQTARDSTLATVLPGTPVRLSLQPSDSAVYVGGSYRLHGETLDRCENATPGGAEGITYATSSGAISIASDGTVRGQGIGRAQVTGRTGALTDSVDVSVVPAGRIAVVAGARLMVLDLDGSRAHYLGWPLGNYLPPAWVAWAPDRSELFFSGDGRLWSADTTGTWHELLTSLGAGQDLAAPAPSRDGAWLFFAARPKGGFRYREWRARSDGSEPQELVSDTSCSDGAPALSPDGQRLTYPTVCGYWEVSSTHVLDLTGGAETDLGFSACVIRWSPDDSLLAYVADDRVHVVRPDGTADRIVSDPARAYGPSMTGYPCGLDWSPDGKYLIAQEAYTSASALDVIEVSTGLTLPLGYASAWNMRVPVWRP